MASKDTDSVESFEMDMLSEESEEDEEEPLFVKNGKKKKDTYENGSAKKPLIKGSKKNGKRRRRYGDTEVRTGNPAAKRCCGPVCYVLVGIKTVMGLAAITIVLTNYFTHSDWLFWNFGLSSSSQDPIDDIEGCDELEVTPVWQIKFPKLLTEGNTRMVHVNSDGVMDVVIGFGTGADGYNIPDFVCDIYFDGQKPCLGGVLALDGKDGHELWRLWTEHEIFSLTCQADLDSDNVTDCLAGGRAGLFLAISVKTGEKIWDFADHAVKSDLMSVYAAQFVQDLDSDGVQDVLAVHGGDPLSDPAHRNMWGRLILFSGRDGRLLRWMATPDRRESYYPPQVLTRGDGDAVVIYGTGGNTNSGALYAISLLDLYRKNTNMTRLIYRDYAKGILSPALLVDVNGDGLEDIVLSTINSNVMAFDGATFSCLWNRTLAGFESITGIAAAMWDHDDTPDIMVKFAYGAKFPVYQFQQSLVLCGRNGTTLASLAEDTLPSLSSPLGLSMTGRGNDMFLHWSSNCGGGAGPGEHVYYDFRSGTQAHEQSRADLCRALRGSGTLSRLVAVSSKMTSVSRVQEIYNSTYWGKFEHNGSVNTSLQADRYLAKHPELRREIEQLLEEDNEYSVLPYKNNNYDNAMKLLEEEMAKEYGEGQPFIDPGSQAYEAFDYEAPGDNESSDEGPQPQQPVLGYPVQYPGQMQVPMGMGYGQPQYPQMQMPLSPQGYPQMMATPEKQRRKRDLSAAGGSLLLPGLSRQTGTGTLAPSLLPANDTIDVVFPVHWIYPPKIDVLQQGDLDCIKATLEKRMGELTSEEQLPELTSKVEEKCLNASGHFAPRDAVYETPSDYDPVAINMGQLIIYRFQLRCKCKKVPRGKQCASILPLEKQGWPSYMGLRGDSIYRRQGGR